MDNRPIKIENFVIEKPFNVNSKEGSKMLEFHILQRIGEFEEYTLKSVSVNDVQEGFLVVLLLELS